MRKGVIAVAYEEVRKPSYRPLLDRVFFVEDVGAKEDHGLYILDPMSRAGGWAAAFLAALLYRKDFQYRQLVDRKTGMTETSVIEELKLRLQPFLRDIKAHLQEFMTHSYGVAPELLKKMGQGNAMERVVVLGGTLTGREAAYASLLLNPENVETLVSNEIEKRLLERQFQKAGLLRPEISSAPEAIAQRSESRAVTGDQAEEILKRLKAEGLDQVKAEFLKGNFDNDLKALKLALVDYRGSLQWKPEITSEDIQPISDFVIAVSERIGKARSEVRLTPVQEKQFQKAMKDLVAHVWDRVAVEAGVKRRAAAIKTLGELKDLRAMTALIKALRDDQPAVRRSAKKTLDVLVKDSDAVLILIEVLKTGDVFARIYAAETLGKLKDLRAVPALIEALKDEQISVRQAAADALGELKDPRAIAGLTAVSKDRSEHEFVRFAASQALKAISDPRTLVQDESILDWRSKHGKTLQQILDQFVKEYDFRGFDGADDVNYPQQVDEELLRWVGNALGSVKFYSQRHDRSVQLKAGDSFVIAGDNGPSTQKFKDALIVGLRDAGINVIDLGVTVSGNLYKSISNFGVQGGLYVTRSHVEVGTNGAKPNIGGITLYGGMLQQAKYRILDAQYAKADQRGTLSNSKEVLDQSREMYLESLMKGYGHLPELLKSAGMKVAFNLNSGSATGYVPFFQKMFGQDVTLLKSEGDPMATKGLADPTRLDKKALAHPDANMVQYSKDHPDVFVMNFDLDVDRVSLLQGGQLYLGDEMFYCMIEYMLTLDPYKDLLRKIYPDSRMKIEFGQLVRHFGGTAKLHPKGHSKVKATIDILLSQMVKTGGFQDVAALLKVYPGFRIAQSEYSLHFFLTSDRGEAFDDALEFSLFWLNVFAKIKLKHQRTDWSYGDYVRDLKAKSIIKESIQIKEQRTAMPDDVKGAVMDRMKDSVMEYFKGRSDFTYVPDWEADYEAQMKPYTLINIEGVYHLITPMGEMFWGQSNTSPKVSFGTQSTSVENTRKLAGITAALMIRARQKVAPQAPKFHPLEAAELFKAWLSDTHKVSFADWSRMYSNTDEAKYDAWLSDGLEDSILFSFPTDEAALSEFSVRSEVRMESARKSLAVAVALGSLSAAQAAAQFVTVRITDFAEVGPIISVSGYIASRTNVALWVKVFRETKKDLRVGSWSDRQTLYDGLLGAHATNSITMNIPSEDYGFVRFSEEDRPEDLPVTIPPTTNLTVSSGATIVAQADGGYRIDTAGPGPVVVTLASAPVNLKWGTDFTFYARGKVDNDKKTIKVTFEGVNAGESKTFVFDDVNPGQGSKTLKTIPKELLPAFLVSDIKIEFSGKYLEIAPVRSEVRLQPASDGQVRLTEKEEKRFQKAMKDLEHKWYERRKIYSDKFGWMVPANASKRRINAARTLGEFRDPRAVHLLKKMLAHYEGDDFRIALLEALGRIGDPSAMPAISEFFTSIDPVDREAAFRAAELMGLPALPALATVLKDKNISIRELAIKTLKSMNAFSLLSEGITSEYPDVRSAGYSALGEFGNFPAMIKGLNDPSPHVRAAIVWVFSEHLTPNLSKSLLLSSRMRASISTILLSFLTVKILSTLSLKGST
ncbi:MAG: HEAT repeat domain-containing protein, partial [Candidatus Omnitrophica bacterium]|nr:HEAT repeat domain-containing protein [Candidatus Omnitrophota bacterium]